MSSMTFGQLVKNQMKNPSDDVVKAAEYVIQFGKHKGMNLAMLMEEQNGYCQWLLKQDQIGSQNPKFNDAVHHLKILILDKQVGLEMDSDQTVFEGGVIDLGAENKQTVMKDYHADNLIIDKGVVKVDGHEVVDGDIMIMHIDPASHKGKAGSHKIESGLPDFVEDPPHTKPLPIIPVGLLMGAVTDLMNQVDEGMTFDFSSEDIALWLQLVSQVELGVNQFVIIETQSKFQGQQSHAQKIKMVVSDLKKLKGVF